MVRRFGNGRGMGLNRPNLALATALSALVAQACGQTESSGADPGVVDRAGSSSSSAGAAGSGGTAGMAGPGSGGLSIDVTPRAGSGGSGGEACPQPVLFAEQVVGRIGPQRVFFSWTTDEQVTELRGGAPLFSRSERPGQGRGLLFTSLANLAQAGSSPTEQLAGILANELFVKARFGWPNPWATLLGLPGESYGTQLLQIELKPEAWIAHFTDGGLTVFDASGQGVSIEDALANPERIGAIYHQTRGDRETSYCGTFERNGVGFREFALGNLQMVARWSLATPEIAARLARDIAELERFEAELACLNVAEQSSWLDQLHCEWTGRFGPSGDTLSNYDASLGLPNELYWPSPDNVAALIAALEVSMPSGAPLEVEPGE